MRMSISSVFKRRTRKVRRRLPMTICRNVLTAGMLLLHAAIAWANVVIIDGSLIENEKQRTDLLAATQALESTGTNMVALEAIVSFFGAEVVGTVGFNRYYSYTDPVKQGAYKVLWDMYSTRFLFRAAEEGSDLAVYWALRRIQSQARNTYEYVKNGAATLSNEPRIVARKGHVTPEVKRALIPVLSKLIKSTNNLVNVCANDLAKDFRLLMDKEDFLKSLADPDEENVAKAISRMLETAGIDPLITPQIWDVLGRAKSDYLKYTCLRYPWLFDLEAFDRTKRDVLVRLLEDFRDGIGTNLNSALEMLARSRNPLAEEILYSLARSDSPKASARMQRYIRVYEGLQKTKAKEEGDSGASPPTPPSQPPAENP